MYDECETRFVEVNTNWNSKNLQRSYWKLVRNILQRTYFQWIDLQIIKEITSRKAAPSISYTHTYTHKTMEICHFTTQKCPKPLLECIFGLLSKSCGYNVSFFFKLVVSFPVKSTLQKKLVLRSNNLTLLPVFLGEYCNRYKHIRYKHIQYTEKKEKN